MSTNNNIVQISGHPAAESKKSLSQNKEIIASCRTILTAALPKCFVFLDNLDDTLFKLADQAKNNREQSEYFAAMRQFRVKQSDLKSDFTQLVLNDFDAFFSNPLASNASHPHLELSLLQNDDLEEDIAITRISSKSEAVFGNEFTQLNLRFAHLLHEKKMIDIPLAADRIASHLKTVISPITSNLVVKLQAYKQFEQHAIDELHILCNQLNEELIKHQILPNLNTNAPKRRTPPAPNTSSLSETVDTESSSTLWDAGNLSQSDADMFEELRQYLNKNGTSHTVQNDNNGPVSIADQHAILSSLSYLQRLPTRQESYSQNGIVQLPELRQLLLSNLNSRGTEAHQSVSNLDEDTIDVIDLLFEFILEDSAIPVPIRAMLARLQIPMLKVAITDKKFFSSKNHPARSLLNNLAKISTGWNQQKGSQQDLIQGKIDFIVMKILNEFDTDVSLFEDLNSDLKQFIEHQGQNSTAAEQRIVQANEGQEKLISAQRQVDKVIQDEVSAYPLLPKVVISLIDDGWKHVLKLRLLQKGSDSPEWQDSITTLKQLIWSVVPQQDPNDRKKLLATIPNLMKELKTGLSGASFNQPKMTALLKDLQACHIKNLKGDDLLSQEDIQFTDIFSEPPEADESEILAELPAEEKVITEEAALEKASMLKVGTWLEIIEEDSRRRMKFSWRSNLTGKCLFVTYQGLKAAELSLAELASLFLRGKALVIDQSEPLMDRALISMMSTVNKQKNTDGK